MKTRDKTDWIVWHCSATAPKHNTKLEDIRRWHKEKGWSDVGYHFVIERDGKIRAGRHPDSVGAHVRGHNHNSIGICLVGGLDDYGNAADNFSTAQKFAARHLGYVLQIMYPGASHRGHRDFSPDLNGDGTIQANERIKECPCIEMSKLLGERPDEWD